ncbi:MAG: putative metal-binding motif-containing protein, partial [Myxococcota bacterium]|nr:putative metal-binding motif-containing protein [Myxococcota bacterium]
MVHRRSAVLVCAFVWILASGCAPAPISGDAAVRGDGAARCASASECDDGVFCNGAERCDPDGAGGDACVAGEPPCGAGTFCDEVAARCEASCARDVDGDGHTAMSCGGDDCDDDDASRSPSAVELCDAEHVDEDCDPATLGDRDADDDGSISVACCNEVLGALRCGDDCDDANPTVHRTASEVCDDFDNDCDGAIDERVSYTLWPDADRDSFGDALGTPMRACSYLPGHALIGEDCDDAVATTNPGVHDVCNGVDDDCDGAIDEGADARCGAVP